MAAEANKGRDRRARELGARLFPDVPAEEPSGLEQPQGAGLGAGQHAVMISYSSQNTRVAYDLCAAIEAHGLKCWIAPRDVAEGEVYGAAIADAIGAAQALVLVLSHDSHASRHVLNEVAAAFDGGLSIYVLKIDDVALEGGMSYYLRTVHWEVVSGSSMYPHYTSLAARISEALTMT